ncbi:MAG: hypothetical protein HGA59_03035 [Chlorobiaceae bacterium]|nr:hypothetical protein [Chlorobiaceae bacterium]
MDAAFTAVAAAMEVLPTPPFPVKTIVLIMMSPMQECFLLNVVCSSYGVLFWLFEVKKPHNNLNQYEKIFHIIWKPKKRSARGFTSNSFLA